MLYFLITTSQCNLRCKYCGGHIDSKINDDVFGYDLDRLKEFLKVDEDPIIIFYGGEPLQRMDRITDIMQTITARFLLQTNGLYLTQVPENILNRFEAILVSIDGRPEVNNYYRGKNTYESIIHNCNNIRERGYHGDLVARMTVSEKTDIFSDVTHLKELVRPKFDHVHWQLDVLWDDNPRRRWKNFIDWRDVSYNPGISRLIKNWLTQIEITNQVPGVVPFQSLMGILLEEAPVELLCGAGIDAFSISMDGTITVCPVSTEYEFAKLGSIISDNIKDLTNKIKIEGLCTDCEVKSICGGRCLFANKTVLWGSQYFQEVCQTVKHLIQQLQDIRPQIKSMIGEQKVSISDFKYPSFNNGLEIIP